MNIILCGLPMSGKTTIGKMLAEHLNWSFIDTDRLIEHAYALSTQKSWTCRQIFIEEGEKDFREIEKEQIASLHGLRKTIVAVGGGVLCDAENCKMLKCIGNLVYLQTPLKILWERIQGAGVPPYLDAKNPEKAFYDMAQKRLSLYEEATNFTIDTTFLSVQEVVVAIIYVCRAVPLS